MGSFKITREEAEAHNHRVALGRKPPVTPPERPEPVRIPPAPENAPKQAVAPGNGDAKEGFNGKNLKFTVHVNPMGAVRMNRSDKWKKRPCVLRYREYRDRLRAAMIAQVGQIPAPDALIVRAFIRIPDSWTKKKKAEMEGRPHKTKPDWDNIGKVPGDLWEQDSRISSGTVSKRWCAAGNERLEIVCVYFGNNESENKIK